MKLFEQFCACKFNNLDEMDKFLGKQLIRKLENVTGRRVTSNY